LGAQREQTHTLSLPLMLYIRRLAFMAQEVWKYDTIDSKHCSWINIIIFYFFPVIILHSLTLGTIHLYLYDMMICLLTAVGLSPGGSTHLHTNNT
jgi:hypothetical protein